MGSHSPVVSLSSYCRYCYCQLYVVLVTLKMICQTILSVCLLLLLTNHVNVSADMTDADQASDSDTSGTSDVEMDLDNKDPNLHNPQARQGYGIPGQSPKFGTTTTKTTTRKPKTTTPPRSLGEQSIRAALQLGIVVGVCLMVVLGFMAMVGIELLCDQAWDKYRRLIKKPIPLPDVERLHPAELVGKFSRYK